MSTPYQAQFAAGDKIRIVSRERLEAFLREWRLHNPLTPQQLEQAGRVAVVEDVGFYHGGDALYSLSGMPGSWHEVCLERA